MAEEPVAAFDGSIPTSMEECQKLLKRFNQISEDENDALTTQKANIESMAKQTARIVDPILKEKQAILDAFKQYFDANRKSILAKYGRTITLPEGVFKVRVIPKSLEVPKDVKLVVAWLLARPRLKRKYLRVKYELDKEALAVADARLLRRMNRSISEFWAGRHERVSLKLRDEQDPIGISTRRYPGGKP
ncbi:MAG TPA: host-nuclease inhibitor Gam family protein [Candidatus Saccharimonadales bacterium]